jgi:hypothetical protein
MKNALQGSVGLRVKTGKAIAVILSGPVARPVVLKRGELILADPNIADTWQPYHAVMDLPWPKAELAVKKTARSITSAAYRSLRDWTRQAQEAGLTLCGVGAVAGSLADPAKIGNPHIRAHAAEGRLFREAVEAAAEQLKLFHCCFAEDGLYEAAAAELGITLSSLKTRAAELGATVGRPWRGDEKAAAVAAWLVLKQRMRSRRSP